MRNLLWILALVGCDTDTPPAPAEFSCEAFAEPDDCLEQTAVLVAQTCKVPAGEVGELDASRTECTFSDGTIVTFDPPVPDVITQGDPISMWIDYVEPAPSTEDDDIPHTCIVLTDGEAYPRRVSYEVDDEAEAKWYQDTEENAISISCDPQTVTTADAAELLECDAFPVTPFRVTNASIDGKTVRSVALLGTALNVSCALPD